MWTHWGRVTQICVSKISIICSDNGLSPGWFQATIWTNAGILLIGPLGINFGELLIKIKFSLKKMHLKISSAKWLPFCLGLNVLKFQALALYMTKYIWDPNFVETSILRYQQEQYQQQNYKMLSTKFIWLSVIPKYTFWPGDIIQNGHQNLTIFWVLTNQFLWVLIVF